MASREQQKRQRHQLLRRLLLEEPVRDQTQLQALLKRAGVSVTQTTVSRDLAELGVVRAREGREHRYRLPQEEEGAGGEALRRWQELVCQWVLSVAVAGNQVVLRTGPGQANGVASFLDSLKREGVLGSIAGDDTILVIASTPRVARQFAQELQELREGRLPPE